MKDLKERQDAMKWWNNLHPVQRQAYIDKDIRFVGRGYGTLTGREIEILYLKTK